MKLANRYQRTNLIATLAIFLLASFAFYLSIHRVLVLQTDDDLDVEKREIENYIATKAALPYEVVPIADRIVSFKKINAPIPNAIYKTAYLLDPVEQEQNNFRQIIFSARVGNTWYLITISKSLESTEALAKSISQVAMAMIILMLIVSLFVNRIILKKLWKPFYNIIDNLRTFKLGKNEKIALPSSNIEEFALLKDVLEVTTAKAANDYQVLKEFTENASHELQTPLAIIRSKLDLLIQDETLSESQSDIIQDSFNAVRRMTYLNNSLLQLAKIENGQYVDKVSINLKALLEEKLHLFEVFFNEAGIALEADIQECIISINPLLADILINNLLSNAIYHNCEHGAVDIILTSSGFQISNTSRESALNESCLFNRFGSNKNGKTRTGIGLALVKQVCDASQCFITYSYSADKFHSFSISWDEKRT